MTTAVHALGSGFESKVTFNVELFRRAPQAGFVAVMCMLLVRSLNQVRRRFSARIMRIVSNATRELGLSIAIGHKNATLTTRLRYSFYLIFLLNRVGVR